MDMGIVSLAMAPKQRVAARCTHSIHRTTFPLLCALLFCAGRLAAQKPTRLDLGGTIEVGGEEERYLRALQIAGIAPLTSWTIQPFAPSEVRALRTLKANPWAERYDSAAIITSAGAGLLRAKARIIGNSGFPFQDGGGPTWAGRGFTGELQAGAWAHWKDLSLQLAPLIFESQNAAFPLAPNGFSGNQRFADGRFPNNIDAPQRFGDKAYGRFTPGTSSLAFDFHHLLVAASTAPQRWGPAREFPLVLGPNAGGFPVVYAGTSEPVNLWLFRLHARVIYGELGQSAFIDTVAGTNKRLASGLVMSLMPRGVPGLEIGASRFIHHPWTGFPNSAELARPFSGIISNNLPGSDLNQHFENQNASVFARWALPSARAEFYGEMYREDYPGGFHVAASTLVEKPDDYSSFTLGFQRATTATPHHVRVYRAELVNGQTSHQERGQRGFTSPHPTYIHAAEREGHTLDGLILGSPEAYGGEGLRVGVDDFTPSGRRSIGLERSLRLDWLAGQPVDTAVLLHPDVIYDVRLEWLRFRGASDVGITLIPAIDLNRNLVASHDVFNLYAAFTIRGW